MDVGPVEHVDVVVVFLQEGSDVIDAHGGDRNVFLMRFTPIKQGIRVNEQDLHEFIPRRLGSSPTTALGQGLVYWCQLDKSPRPRIRYPLIFPEKAVGANRRFG
jgi:hypothetical protein